MVGKYIFYAITFIMGLVVKHYYDLYRNKIQIIKYTISKVFAGASEDSKIFGKVQVLHNDIPVENLYLCKIDFINTTNKDFKDLKIDVWCDLDSEILTCSALKKGSIHVFKPTKEYMEECRNITTGNSAALNRSRRPYDIPVLNRNDEVYFSCLVSSKKGVDPLISLACEHAGLKFEAIDVLPSMVWGENRTHGVIYGIIISAILMIPTLYFISPKIIATIVAFILGIFCLIPGILFLKLLRKIRKSMR